MHVLAATDGSGDIAEIAKFAYALTGSEGVTTVATVVLVPRQLVSQLREDGWGETKDISVDADAEYVGTRGRSDSMLRSFPGDDAVVDQYIGDKRVERCNPVRDAIHEFGGNAESIARECTDVPDGIMSVAAEIDADVIIVGSHGHGAFKGLLGSTGAKLVRRAKRPVLILR